MIIDTSTVIAIGNGEPEADRLLELLAGADELHISAANWVELGIVVDRRDDPLVARRSDALLDELGVVVQAVSVEQARIARDCYRDFGKGRHRAGLNFGDCFAYALAKDYKQALIFVGNDFGATDIVDQSSMT